MPPSVEASSGSSGGLGRVGPAVHDGTEGRTSPRPALVQLRGDSEAMPTHEPATDFGRTVVFGESERPLVGRLHEARGAVVGAVVLCSPWGYEENCSYATFRLLAQRLARSGIETLRFDYECCGNSWGDYTEPLQLNRWIASCSSAFDYMWARTGQTISVVGLRLGATLAALASSAHPMAACVLWDPVVNGRRYLRAVRAMSMMGVNAGPDPTQPDSLVAIGNYLTKETVGDLEKLQLQQLTGAQMSDTLIVARPGSADSRRLADALEKIGVPTTLEEHPGTETMLDCAAEQSVVPQQIVDRIVGWLQERPSGSTQRAADEPLGAASLDSRQEMWTEEHITVGPRGLAGVLTLPRHPQRAGAVVMANNGASRSIGPARAWVEWARLWAEAGMASLRLDFGGLGDSPAPAEESRNDCLPIEAIDDLAAAVDELGLRGLSPVVAVGLCSGAFLSIDAAAAGVGLIGVAGVNALLYELPDAPGSPHRLRRAAPPAHPWIQRFLESKGGRVTSRYLPYLGWRLLDLLRLLPAPLRGADIASTKTRMLLVYGQDNEGLLRLRQRGKRDLLRWQKEGKLVVLPGLDHSMFAPQMRTKVEAVLRPFLLELLPRIEKNGR